MHSILLLMLLWGYLNAANSMIERASDTSSGSKTAVGRKSSGSHKLVHSDEVYHMFSKHDGFPYLEEHLVDSFAKLTSMTYIYGKGRPLVKGFVW